MYSYYYVPYRHEHNCKSVDFAAHSCIRIANTERRVNVV